MARTWAVAMLATMTTLGMTAGAHAAPGDPDPRFGSAGRFLSPQTSLYSTALALQPDGKVLVAGVRGIHAGSVVYRLNPDGTPDPSFGDGGRADVEGLDVGAIALQGDGRIVLAGSGYTGDAGVDRLTAHGVPDPTFDDDGRVQLDTGGNEWASAVAVAPGEAIVVAGGSTLGSHAVVWRLKPDGAPDDSFDTDGVAGIGTSNGAWIGDISVRPDGRILAVGATTGSTGDLATIWQLRSTGGNGTMNDALDQGFGSGGSMSVSNGGPSSGRAVVLGPDGRSWMGGTSEDGADGSRDPVVYRFAPDGTLEVDFAEAGQAVLELGGRGGVSDIALQPDGKPVVAVTQDGTEGWEGVAARLTGAGTLDPTFGDGGVVRPDPDAEESDAVGVAVDAHRRVLVAGGSAPSDGSDRMAVHAFFGDPYSLNVSYAGDGSGTVGSTPAGSVFDHGTPVTLTAAPAAGSVFAGWSGACPGSRETACVVTVGPDVEVTATFAKAPAVAPPVARIVDHPKRRVRTKRRRAVVRFALAADRAGVAFQCRLDRRRFTSCGPRVRLRVRRGRHRFRARAVDAAGAGPVVSYRFRVKRKR